MLIGESVKDGNLQEEAKREDKICGELTNSFLLLKCFFKYF